MAAYKFQCRNKQNLNSSLGRIDRSRSEVEVEVASAVETLPIWSESGVVDSRATSVARMVWWISYVLRSTCEFVNWYVKPRMASLSNRRVSFSACLFFVLLAGENCRAKTHQTASTSVRPSASAKRYMVQTTD